MAILERPSDYKNIIILAIAFTLLITSYNGMENLQSSVNKKLGTTSLWTIYTIFGISAFFLPSLVIRKLGTKWTIVGAILCYTTYIAAQLHPTYYTLIPTAAIVGLSGSCLWTAQSVYITKTGEKHAQHLNGKTEVSIARFFSLFYTIMGTNQIWGNFISSKVFSIGTSTVNRSEEFLSHCGINYCPSFAPNITSLNDNLGYEVQAQAEKEKLSTFALICISVSLLAALVTAIFLKPLPSDSDSSNTSSIYEDLSATFMQMKRVDQMLMIPITIFDGVNISFMISDVTAGYISCTMGVHHVGYFMVTFGMAAIIGAALANPLIKYFGQIKVFILSSATSVIMIIVLIHWIPQPSSSYFSSAVVIGALIGAFDSIWNILQHVLYGVMFPGSTKAAFSNQKMWGAVGYVIGFVLSGYVCAQMKAYIILAFLLVGALGYGLTICRKNNLGNEDDSEHALQNLTFAKHPMRTNERV